MDEVFGAQGLAAADLRRQAEINDRIGLSAYEHERPPTEKYDADSYKGDKAWGLSSTLQLCFHDHDDELVYYTY